MDLDNITSFTNRWCKEVRIITLLVLIISVFISVLLFKMNNITILVKLLILFPLWCSHIYYCGISPIGIEINSSSLIIKRLFNNIIIKKNNIIYAKCISNNVVYNSVRIWGSSGFCGFLGIYKGEIGKFEMYITEKSNLMLIVTNSRKYVKFPLPLI